MTENWCGSDYYFPNIMRGVSEAMRWKVCCIVACILSGCTTDVTQDDTLLVRTVPSHAPTYSLYGKSMQSDEKTGLMYLDVYVGGDRRGAEKFAEPEFKRYAVANGLISYEIVKVEYTFFPLSKYRFFVRYK